MNKGQGILSIRPAIKFALAWRVISELMRRHHAEHDLRVSQFFPGLSPWGVLRLSIGRPFGRPAKARCVDFEIGGGGCGVTTASEQPVTRYTRIIDGEDSIRIADEIEARMGWAHRENGPTTAPILTARVIARFLERYMVAPTPFRLSPGGIDNAASYWDGSSTGWLAGLPEARAVASMDGVDLMNFQTRFWLLHQDHDNGPLSNWSIEMGPAVVFDMATADCIPLHGAKKVNLLQRYKHAGHRLRPVLHELETLIDAP
jgi:hypothetical protein